MPRSARVLLLAWIIGILGIGIVVIGGQSSDREQPAISAASPESPALAEPGLVAASSLVLHSYVVTIESSLDPDVENEPVVVGGDEAFEPTPSEDPEDQTNRTAAGDSLCRPHVVGEAEGEVVSIYRVTEGELGDLCFGTAEPLVVDAWNLLTEFAIPADLDSIRLFAGIESETVAAFAGPFGRFSGDEFVVAVDLYSAGGTPDYVRVTMAHELGHVLTMAASQHDAVLTPENCPGFHNGWICYAPDSYMSQWTSEFWTSDQLASLPTSGEIDEEAGGERCALDQSFVGPYAASHPEEDFAEAFSAFIYQVDVASKAEPRLEFFERFPEFVELRDRAAASGQAGLQNYFGRCG